ncbi:MAG TPA: helix-turn-helix transcriptional regulator [Chitinophagaceae bacterium]|nr:helix-turn-helix transcriptional regulator [Chitinophagaceae bacterium]
MKTKEIFSSNLRIKKEELKLTQGQLANSLGVKRATVAAWLEGRSAPRLEDTPKLIEVFEIKDFHSFLTKKIA